ncbi:MAG: hypothetical protein R3B70_12765 [Polyangiaceae bacterium]
MAAAAAILAVAAGGCEDSSKPVKAPAACKPPVEVDVPVVGLASGDSCPSAGDAKDGSWAVAPVFSAESGETLPASMRRLCAYTWSGCGAPDMGALPMDELEYAGDDPPIVQALGAADKASAEIAMQARARLAKSADALSPLPKAGGAVPVMIGVPDTSPWSMEPDTISLDVVSHGFDIAWIARYLACPNGPSRTCLGRVRTDLALRRPGVGRDRIWRRAWCGWCGLGSAKGGRGGW